MGTAEFFREKAAHCRAMAANLAVADEFTERGLLALALEFDARALAVAAGQAAAREIEPEKGLSPGGHGDGTVEGTA